MIQRLAIIGVGLIGGSLSLALKQAGQVQQTVGYSRQVEVREEALRLGVVDQVVTTMAEAVSEADMIFIAVPMAAMPAVLNELAQCELVTNAIITDGGSAKESVVTAAKASLKQSFKQFVPGHPIAGTEKSGPSAAFADLYQQHRVVLTPTDETNTEAVERVTAMWQAVGAEVFQMAPHHHDEVLAATSHLPHLLAFNLVGMLAQRDDCEEILRYAAGGFKDFSRIASSDAVMWRDICLTNQSAILDLISQYQSGLTQLSELIAAQNGDALVELFTRAKAARDSRFS